MEALAALSIACNVFQVLDLAYNLIKGGIHLAQPGEDSLPENASASKVTEDLKNLMGKIQIQTPSAPIDPQLLKICSQCEELAQELIDALNKLKATKKRQVVTKLIRAQFEKKKLAVLEHRLEVYRSEIHLYITGTSSRIDVQTVQQSDDFKALNTKTQENFLTLLQAVEDGTVQITDHIDKQTDLIKDLHLETKQTSAAEAENLRNVLADESEQSRLQIVANVQSSIDQSASETNSKLLESTTALKGANAAMQDVVTGSIKSSQQTIQNDIQQLYTSIQLLRQEWASQKAKLDQVILLSANTQSDGRRKELQQEGTRLTRFILSLQALYTELQSILASLLNQARAMFGPIRFKELFRKEIREQEVETINLDDRSRGSQSSTFRRAVNAFSNVSAPQIKFGDTGFHAVKMRVSMMKPIKSSRAVRGHYRSQSATPSSGDAATLSNPRNEEINTDIVVLYYQYCYRPFLPLNPRLLSPRKWQHREHKLPNPLEEYKKNIRRHKVIIGEEAAVIELARRGDEFVWFMALAVAAVEVCVGWQRCIRVVRVIFSIVSNWVDGMKKTAGATDPAAEIVVTRAEIGPVGESMRRICRDQDDDDVPGFVGKFDQTTVLGGRLEEDILLWKKIADISGLSKEVQDFVDSNLETDVTANRSKKGDTVKLYASSDEPQSNRRNSLHDAQIVFLLVYMLMANRINMAGIIQPVHSTPGTEEAAFAVTRLQGTVQFMFDIQENSLAMVMAKVLSGFGSAGLLWKESRIETAFRIAREILPPPSTESNEAITWRENPTYDRRDDGMVEVDLD